MAEFCILFFYLVKWVTLKKERNTQWDTVPFLSTSPSVHCLLGAGRTHSPSYRAIRWWLILWFVGVAKGAAYNHSVAGDWRQCTSYSPACIYMTLLGACSRKSSDVSHCCYVLWVGRAMKHFTERKGGWGVRGGEQRESMSEETSRPCENVSHRSKLVTTDCGKWIFSGTLLLFFL